MAVIEASLRSLLRNLSQLYVPFADAKDGLCGFDYLIKEKPQYKLGFSLMVEMAETEASLRSLLRNLSQLYVPFADAKDGLCGFDYLIKEKPQYKLGFSLMVEMAETEASLRSLLRNLSQLYVPFADAKDGLCGFDYLIKEKPQYKLEFSLMVEMAVIETASENLFL